TRATAILAAGFMGTSITLAILANNTREPSSILDRPGMTGVPDAPVKEPVGVPLSK
ncbi:MAG: preprotein translocase subunit SecG, partial [Alphaproteobacteria bacterium]